MRRIVLGLLLPGSLWAAAPVCDKFFPCSAPMATIESRYNSAASTSPLLLNLPSVFSGECYHRGSGFDPNETQFGIILLEQESTGFYFNGRFSLGDKENPFQRWTVADARERLSELYHENRRLLLYADRVEANLFPTESGDKIRRYWMKWDTQNRRLLLLSQWGQVHHVFCSLR